MLIGEYASTITAGNRTALPKKFRSELSERLIITRGYEGCLILVTQDQWQEMVVDAASGPFVSQDVRDTSRFLLGGAHEISLDSQGRFVLPASLKDHASIEDNVVFLGLGRWVEVWDQETWNKRQQYIETNGSEIAERLSTVSLS